MTILALQLKSGTAKLGAFKALAIGAVVVVTATGFADLTLSASSVSLSRGDSNYSVINASADEAVIDGVVIRIATQTARLTIKLLLFTDQNISYVAHHFQLDIDDFRYDQGADGASISLVSRSAISIPKSANIIIGAVSERQKLTGTPEHYVYGLNPVDYLKYSKGTMVTDGAITGQIVASKLALGAGQSSTFNIEITP